MRVEIDTHTHTLASGHAYNTMNEMAKAAADKGLKGLAITEHAPEMPGTLEAYAHPQLCTTENPYKIFYECKIGRAHV